MRNAYAKVAAIHSGRLAAGKGNQLKRQGGTSCPGDTLRNELSFLAYLAIFLGWQKTHHGFLLQSILIASSVLGNIPNAAHRHYSFPNSHPLSVSIETVVTK